MLYVIISLVLLAVIRRRVPLHRLPSWRLVIGTCLVASLYLVWLPLLARHTGIAWIEGLWWWYASSQALAMGLMAGLSQVRRPSTGMHTPPETLACAMCGRASKVTATYCDWCGIELPPVAMTGPTQQL